MSEAVSDTNHARRGEAMVGWQDYVRAEQFLPWNAERRVFRMKVEPNWMPGSDRFWYRVATRDGAEFVLVDPETGTRRPAFDHARLAAALTVATGRPYDARTLPFDRVRFAEDGSSVAFDVDGTTWTCDLETYTCTRATGEEPVAPPPPRSPDECTLPSPDGRWVALARDHNLVVRDNETGEEVALTSDGQPEFGYATPILSPLLSAGLALPEYGQYPLAQLFPAAIWSPDSTKIITHRMDERGAGKFHLVQSVPLDGSTRPRLHSCTYPLPGDDPVPTAELIIFDVAGRQAIPVDVPPLHQLYYGTPLMRRRGEMASNTVWWSDCGRWVYVLRRERGYRSMALYEVDAATGRSRVLVEETSETPIDPSLTWGPRPNVRVIEDGAGVIWFSQRDGWAHLYLYDAATGALVRQLTSGPWVVSELLHVDEAARLVYFTAVGKEEGRDPYAAHLYRVSLDGGEPELLTPEDADHIVTISPSGRYFVDTYSRVDLPPVSVLRATDGRMLCELERADVGLLEETGWRPPERFRAKGRDGVTDVYGVIFRPSTFDPSRSYPVIDSIYGGPQTNQAPVSFADIGRGRSAGFWHAQALAELGFIVVMIDGLGMPQRSKAYHDVSYRNLGDAGLEDHIAALRQLAMRYPYLDLDRVGIFGHSAGGYASCHAILAYPDFFKVCVSSAGNHDHRLDKASWVERYMGFPVEDHYAAQANQALAENLQGKLLLIHGDMDENVHISSTLVVVDALIKANKDFDLLIMPNRFHFCGNDPYFVRRRWDYFVEHLLGAEPVRGYRISSAPEE